MIYQSMSKYIAKGNGELDEDHLIILCINDAGLTRNNHVLQDLVPNVSAYLSSLHSTVS